VKRAVSPVSTLWPTIVQRFSSLDHVAEAM